MLGMKEAEFVKRRLYRRATALGLVAIFGGTYAGVHELIYAYESHSFGPGIKVRVANEIETLAHPHDAAHPVSTLHVGQYVQAVCYYESATLGVDSLGLEADGRQQYALTLSVDRTPGGADPLRPLYNFGQTPAKLQHELRAC